MTMNKFFRIPFASSGDVAAIPDDTQIDGSISYEQGYGPDYALDPDGVDPNAKRIERTNYNQSLLDITTALQEYQTHGAPDFITSAVNDGTPYEYQIGATVFQPADNKVYRNTVADNITVPPNTGWTDVTVPIDGTTSAKGVVQLSNSDTSTSTTLAATIAAVTRRARITANEIISGVWTFSTGIRLENDIFLVGKTSTGTNRGVVGMNTSNNVVIGNSNHELRLVNDGGVVLESFIPGTNIELRRLILFACVTLSSTGAQEAGSTNVLSTAKLAGTGKYRITLGYNASNISNMYPTANDLGVGGFGVSFNIERVSTSVIDVYCTRSSNDDPIDTAFHFTLIDNGA